MKVIAGETLFTPTVKVVKQYFRQRFNILPQKTKNISLHILRAMCFLNKRTFRHNWRINIGLNGQMFRFKERTIFCYNLSQRAADNILPQRANVLPQPYEYILPAKKFEFFDCFSLFCFNSI